MDFLIIFNFMFDDFSDWFLFYLYNIILTILINQVDIFFGYFELVTSLILLSMIFLVVRIDSIVLKLQIAFKKVINFVYKKI
jgi:hypothetical protein